MMIKKELRTGLSEQNHAVDRALDVLLPYMVDIDN
jgi:hypothetical protein